MLIIKRRAPACGGDGGMRMSKDEMIVFLWDLLDDIDTASDRAKSDDAAYRVIVERLQVKRWETGITVSGNDLVIP